MQISLTQGKFALVDDEDFECLSKWKWYVNSNGYAIRSVHIIGSSKQGKVPHGKHNNIFLHRFITKVEKGSFVDHINQNKLDNRKENLRVCTLKENCFNKSKVRGSSIYKGVCWDKRANKWIASIHPSRKTKFIGHFPTEFIAAMAYDIWAKELFGEFASLNFN
jgi:hypothetical protein